MGGIAPTIIFGLCCILTAVAAPPTSHSVLKKIPIPGQGSWDYLAVDESARRLYVQDGVQVEVLDIDTGALVGNVPNTLGVHGIAIAPELGRGFVSNGQTSTVTIFEVKTLKPIAQVPTGQKPDAMSMAIDRLNRRLFLGCRSKVMAVISARYGTGDRNASYRRSCRRNGVRRRIEIDFQLQRRGHD